MSVATNEIDRIGAADVIGQGPPDNERINEDIGSDRISQEPLSLSLSISIYLSIYIKIRRANLVISFPLIVGLWVYTNGSTV